jgi:hypothetical protein
LAASHGRRPDDDGRNIEAKMSIRPDADSFIFADLKPTDGFVGDPHNEMDEGLLLPAVRTDDSLLLPAVRLDGALLLPAVQIDEGLLLP